MYVHDSRYESAICEVITFKASKAKEKKKKKKVWLLGYRKNIIRDEVHKESFCNIQILQILFSSYQKLLQISVRHRQAMVGVRDHHFALLQHFVLKAHREATSSSSACFINRSGIRFFFFLNVAERAAPVSAEDSFKQNGFSRRENKVPALWKMLSSYRLDGESAKEGCSIWLHTWMNEGPCEWRAQWSKC